MTTVKKHAISFIGAAAGIGAFIWASMPISQLPAHTLPPAVWGVADPFITQANIGQTICNPKWTTGSVRPSSSYTTALKTRQLKSMGYSDAKNADYEEDHVISLELGGDPTDPMNLFPELYDDTVAGQDLGAHAKDKVENWLHSRVCGGLMTLTEAQKAISGDWVGVLAHMKGYNGPESDTDD